MVHWQGDDTDARKGHTRQLWCRQNDHSPNLLPSQLKRCLVPAICISGIEVSSWGTIQLESTPATSLQLGSSHPSASPPVICIRLYHLRNVTHPDPLPFSTSADKCSLPIDPSTQPKLYLLTSIDHVCHHTSRSDRYKLGSGVSSQDARSRSGRSVVLGVVNSREEYCAFAEGFRQHPEAQQSWTEHNNQLVNRGSR